MSCPAAASQRLHVNVIRDPQIPKDRNLKSKDKAAQHSLKTSISFYVFMIWFMNLFILFILNAKKLKQLNSQRALIVIKTNIRTINISQNFIVCNIWYDCRGFFFIGHMSTLHLQLKWKKRWIFLWMNINAHTRFMSAHSYCTAVFCSAWQT